MRSTRRKAIPPWISPPSLLPTRRQLDWSESSSSIEEAFKFPSAICSTLQPPNTHTRTHKVVRYASSTGATSPGLWGLGSNSRIANEYGYICVLPYCRLHPLPLPLLCYQRPMPLHSMFV
ncbi:hypothetical protein CCUS01_03540 [Colletotrichum cuscutae]|uniref:Uncharacterized protein n=1 Tax=Colletotrichum cuscutae TaxID=1209917 RepID=A0AAI9VI07_9PEZI|nr:hypothetical protein CCUS01_03540 [Colletotrichum cuscutae]